jgi:Domain of unknown function (DUF1906)/Putative peptidoglycan binding domain
MSLLKLGAKGAEVIKLQRLLNLRLAPSPNLPLTGNFLEKTQAAVIRFQSENGLPADGKVGSDTWAVLEEDSAPGYAGFDVSGYPGAHVMQWLWDYTNLYWTGFYLAPAPSHKNTSWMNSYAALKGIGWGVAAIYVGQESQGPGSHIVTALQGKLDGKDACGLASKANFPGGSFVYLDVEQWTSPLAQTTKEYYKAWADAVVLEGYRPAVYCKYSFASELIALTPGARAWVYRLRYNNGTHFRSAYPAPAPSESLYQRADAWQFAQNGLIDLANGSTLQVDLDTSAFSDPSSPQLGDFELPSTYGQTAQT